jgi:hypothetical protein
MAVLMVKATAAAVMTSVFAVVPIGSSMMRIGIAYVRPLTSASLS